jgi:hypothetical protein
MGGEEGAAFRSCPPLPVLSRPRRGSAQGAIWSIPPPRLWAFFSFCCPEGPCGSFPQPSAQQVPGPRRWAALAAPPPTVGADPGRGRAGCARTQLARPLRAIQAHGPSTRDREPGVVKRNEQSFPKWENAQASGTPRASSCHGVFELKIGNSFIPSHPEQNQGSSACPHLWFLAGRGAILCPWVPPALLRCPKLTLRDL